MQRETIIAGDLRLRPFEETDIPWVYEVSLDPLVQKYLQIPVPYHRSDAEFFVREMAVAGWDAGTRAEFVVVDGEVRLGLIEWRAEVGNHASRRVAEKAGFRYEAILRQRLVHRGVRVDVWVGSMLPSESPTRPG